MNLDLSMHHGSWPFFLLHQIGKKNEYTHPRVMPRELGIQALSETREQAPAAGDDDVAEELLPQVGVARVERRIDERG
jgi:hypothetical protein